MATKSHTRPRPAVHMGATCTTTTWASRASPRRTASGSSPLRSSSCRGPGSSSSSSSCRNEAQQHGESFAWADFWPQFLSSTFENWQSEFLQLVWQAVGLALLFWGSSQSKESDERIEAKLDRLLEERGIDPDEVTREVNESL